MDGIIIAVLALLKELVALAPDIVDLFKRAFNEPGPSNDPLVKQIREIFAIDELDDFLKEHKKP